MNTYPRFVAPEGVPLPLEFVEECLARAQRRWVAFSEHGLVCETDDLKALMKQVAAENQEIWVAMAASTATARRILPTRRGLFTRHPNQAGEG